MGGEDRAVERLVDDLGGVGVGVGGGRAKEEGANAVNGGWEGGRVCFLARKSMEPLEVEVGRGGMASMAPWLVVRRSVVDLRAAVGEPALVLWGVVDFLTRVTGWEISTLRTGILEGVPLARMMELGRFRSARTREGVPIDVGREIPKGSSSALVSLNFQKKSLRDGLGLSESWKTLIPFGLTPTTAAFRPPF